ncbi:MAG: hypothetical protein ABIP89_00530 [Polyangiaceae bacterium]
MKTRSIVTFALSLALVAATAGSALADGHRKDDAASFPMKSDVFQQRVDAKLTRMQAHVEKRITEKKLDATQASEMRTRSAERAAKVRAAAVAAEQDGVVTADEAKAVRAAGGGGGGHCKGDKKS